MGSFWKNLIGEAICGLCVKWLLCKIICKIVEVLVVRIVKRIVYNIYNEGLRYFNVGVVFVFFNFVDYVFYFESRDVVEKVTLAEGFIRSGEFTFYDGLGRIKIAVVFWSFFRLWLLVIWIFYIGRF